MEGAKCLLRATHRPGLGSTSAFGVFSSVTRLVGGTLVFLLASAIHKLRL